MRCSNHPERDAIDVCTVCGEVICADCSILINNKVTCKSCIEQEIHSLTGVSGPITTKATAHMSKLSDFGAITYPDIVVGMLITIMLILATLFICLNANLSKYTPYVALMAILALIAIVYDINRVLSEM